MPTQLSKEKILRKKFADYSFIIFFFLIFSFFVIFAIKPNLETAFKLRQELTQLRQLDTDYDAAIAEIISLQSDIEQHRDDLPLLAQAVPSTPQVNQIFENVQHSASESGIPISQLTVSQINLTQATSSSNLKNYKISFQSSSSFESLQKFLASFLTQRRLKLINKLSIDSGQKEGSHSATLSVTMDIVGYYL